MAYSLQSLSEVTCHNPHHLHSQEETLDQFQNLDSQLQEKLGELKNCLDLNKYSCLYQKEKSTNSTLVIYHRGHWASFKGDVPLDQRNNSLKQAIDFYELNKSHEQVESPFLISASSNIGFTIKEIESALLSANLAADSKVILASHSGGYVGLLKTLNYLKKSVYTFDISQIIMLDNFYFIKESTSLIKSFLDKGTKCSGYLTAHNSTRFKERFSSTVNSNQCSMKLKVNHNKGVNACLSDYIQTNDCLKEI